MTTKTNNSNQPLRIRSEVSFDRTKRDAYITVPCVRTVEEEGRMDWASFKRGLYDAAVRYGVYSISERRRLHRSLGFIDENRLPLAIGVYDDQEFALVAPIDGTLDATEVEVVSYRTPRNW